MTRITILLLLFAAGTIILILPDSGKRLFSLSKDHGPSAQDAVGLALILVSYAGLVAAAWKRRAGVMRYKRTIGFKAGIVGLGFGYALIIVSVANDFGYWWILGVALLVVINAVVFYLAFRPASL